MVLDARAFFARSWPGGWVIVSEKQIIVVDKTLSVVGRVAIEAKPEDIALTSDGTMLVVADARTLSSRHVRRSGTKWSVRGNFIGCHAATDYVWAAEGRDDDIEVSVRDPASGKPMRTTTVADPFGGSAVMIFAHPNAASTVLWVAAGQDGQTAYLATDDGTTIDATEIPPRDHLQPTFLPNGDTYLCGGYESLEHRRWPGGERIAVVPWPMSDDDDDQAGSYVEVLPGQFASWSSNNGRIHIVDLVHKRIVDEVTFTGHPVQAVEDRYPILQGDRSPCGDFEYSQRGPDGLVLTVHAQTQLVVSRISDWSPDPGRRPS